MRQLLTILALCLLSATASAQTVKALSYNASNNVVIALTNSNPVVFNNAVTFSNESIGTKIRTLSVDLNMGGTGGSNLILWSALEFDDLYGNDIKETTRTNLSLGLPALTNTSNLTMMRALSGSTNTNHPYSGSISIVGTNNTNTLVFSNGILQSVQ